MAVSNAFVWGSGGAKLTPEQIAKQREIEDALLQKGVDVSPVADWTQGLARVANAAAGSFRRGRLAKAEKENKDWNTGKLGEIAGLLSGSGAVTTAPSSGAATAIPMTSAAGEVSATSPVTGDTYAPFMDTIKTSVQNPYALAAIAATGRAESGWSAANANRTWSDPSESGQPGTAGGIMSWRGPRYQALAATGDLSPQGQAKFFLNEDPQLIQKLNGAKSLEEAQQLMNNAWAFAGYNRPGGESARRLGFAKGYLSGFQGGNNEVASLAPSSGLPAAQAIEAAAPASGYVDPMVSVQPRAAALPAPTTVSAPPAVAQPQQVAQAAPGIAPNGQPIPPAIMEVLSDPRADARTRGIAEILLKQNMQQQQNAREEQNWRARQAWTQEQQRSDPSYQLDQDYKRAQLEALKGKSAKTWQKLDDTTLFNPETGETQRVNAPAAGNGQFRFDGKSVEAQALNGLMDAGTLTPAQAQQLGAGKTITGPNGEIIFMTPQGVFGQSTDGTVSPVSAPQPPTPPHAAGGVDIFGGEAPVPPSPPTPPVPPQAPQQPPATPAQRQGMIQLTEPKVTVDESKAGGFAQRMVDANDLLDTYGNAGLSPWSQAVTDNAYIPDVMENYLVNENFQKYSQARRNFINAQLRRESGAVISPEEFENANKQYFPMPGDTPEVVKQKAQGRKTAVEAMTRDAGPTFKNKGGGADYKSRYGLE